MVARMQHRATCPACFAQQAVNNGGQLVNHGYKRPQHWHSNVGTCSGAGAPHFGTAAGRDFTATLAQRLRSVAIRNDADAVDVLAGTGTVLARKRVAVGVSQDVVVDNPTQLQRADYAARLTAQAQQQRMMAAEFEALVAAWTPAEPVQVAVAKSTGPLVHYRTDARWRGQGAACAASMMGAMRSSSTSRDLRHVTCEKCKAVAARMAEKAALKVVA